ncbi:hypothetical protein [Bradyrhizobium elkanii]|uniref:hypothetical protein n=1 Tax=Bradyrhizobium elkanii TaxID=29448 RepID=UPI0027144B30|nr:hypothetical protein [Bradyrhizobium elkanii]WLB72587.1 hypothetical protein QIH89_01005 [Bradyrhizobium elkanii]
MQSAVLSQPVMVSPAPTLPELKPADEPLPTDVPIDGAILKRVQTDPFFAGAPPVRIRQYTVSSSSVGTSNGEQTNSTSNDDVTVRWIRPEIVNTIYLQQISSTFRGSTNASVIRSSSVLANGIALGYRTSGTSNVPIWAK